MSSLMLSRASNVPTLRVSVLKQIPSKRIFKNYASEIPTDALNTRISNSNISLLVEQAVELTYKVAENKIVPILFSWAMNPLGLRLLKLVRFEQIFRTFTYESPMNAMRPRVYYKCTPTTKLYNIGKSTLAVVGGLGLCYYKLKPSRGTKTYYTYAVPVGHSGTAVSNKPDAKSLEFLVTFMVFLLYYFLFESLK